MKQIYRKIKGLSLDSFYQLLKNRILQGQPFCKDLLQHYIRSNSTRIVNIPQQVSEIQQPDPSSLANIFKNCIYAARQQLRNGPQTFQQHIKHIPNKIKVRAVINFLTQNAITNLVYNHIKNQSKEENLYKIQRISKSQAISNCAQRYKDKIKNRASQGFYTSRQLKQFKTDFGSSKPQTYQNMPKCLMNQIQARQRQRRKQMNRLLRLSCKNKSLKN